MSSFCSCGVVQVFRRCCGLLWLEKVARTRSARLQHSGSSSLTSELINIGSCVTFSPISFTLTWMQRRPGGCGGSFGWKHSVVIAFSNQIGLQSLPVVWMEQYGGMLYFSSLAVVFQSVATVCVNWVEFFSSGKVQIRIRKRRQSVNPQNGWNVNFGCTTPLGASSQNKNGLRRSCCPHAWYHRFFLSVPGKAVKNNNNNNKLFRWTKLLQHAEKCSKGLPCACCSDSFWITTVVVVRVFFFFVFYWIFHETSVNLSNSVIKGDCQNYLGSFSEGFSQSVHQIHSNSYLFRVYFTLSIRNN